MAVPRLAHWVSLAFVVSVVGMMAGAARSSGPLLVGWAIAFLAVIGTASAMMNRALLAWHRRPDALTLGVIENSRLAAVAYAWCGTALQAVYITPVTGIRWQHSWQYGLGLALMAAISFGYAALVSRARATSSRSSALAAAPLLAFVQTLLAAGTAAFMIGSGKLLTRRMDWAANQVFLFGSLAVLFVTLTALVTMRRLEHS